MIIVRIAFAALAVAVLIAYLTSVNKEIAMLAAIAAGGIFLIFCLDALTDFLSVYENLAVLGGVSGKTLKTVVKITLLCYVAEFAVGLIEDFGLRSLADKVSLASKLVIVIGAAPIIESLVTVVSSLAP